jgi:hypothetical protein
LRPDICNPCSPCRCCWDPGSRWARRRHCFDRRPAYRNRRDNRGRPCRHVRAYSTRGSWLSRPRRRTPYRSSCSWRISLEKKSPRQPCAPLCAGGGLHRSSREPIRRKNGHKRPPRAQAIATLPERLAGDRSSPSLTDASISHARASRSAKTGRM